jgi:acetyl-CoA acetyltransferase
VKATIIGVGHAAYTRDPTAEQSTLSVLRDAVVAALADAEIEARDVDGLAVASLSLAPDNAIDVAWRLGFSLGWIAQSGNGGSAGLDIVGHALRGVEGGAARVVVAVAGDCMGRTGYARVAAALNSATRDHLTPLGFGGANALYAMLTTRQMRAFGLGRRDYGRVAMAQRRWAGGNPNAVYRTPLTMDEYLAAPLVADPLCRFDCVPIVAGAQAVVIAAPERGPAHRPRIRVAAFRQSFNHDQQEGDGLRTGISAFVRQLWTEAGVHPDAIDVASIYDDYPAMVLAQLHDLGMIGDGDLGRFARSEIGDAARPINTWGGMLSAGQPGGPAGGLNGVSEIVLQLQQRAGPRQVADARCAVVTGYGMTLYRYGATAAAAVLERAA